MKNFLIPAFCFAIISVSPFVSAAPISESALANSFVATRQEYGETMLNKSVGGNTLRIGGKTFAKGIGTHATSMIPLDVEGDTLAGTVGIDDGADGSGDGVEFRVLGGAGILWSSGKIKKGEAKNFRVKLPAGTRKTYLFAVAGNNNSGDHADWANLNWSGNAPDAISNKPSAKLPVISGKSLGIVPGKKCSTAAFRKALDKLRATGGTLDLEKGEYHFYRENALEMSFHISNHDQPMIHPVQIPLVDLRNVKICGNGSTFIFHGQSLAVLFMDCEKVSLNGVRIDYARSVYSEAKVVGFENGKTLVTIDEKAFPYEVRNGHLRFRGEGWERGINSVIAFRKGSKQIVERTSDIYYGGNAEKSSGGKIALGRDFSKDGAGIAVGDTLTMRTWDRPHPACVIYRAKDTTLRDVSIHSSCGMTLLAQRSENIRFAGSGKATDKTSGMFPRPETGRVYSASADATHFSNVKGSVIVENSFFETMMDDAINVHSTCLGIEAVPAKNQLRCRFKHWQAVGFEVFLPGDTLRFIKGPTLEQGAEIKVAAVRKLNTNELLITLAGDIPAGFGVGDAVENADYQCAVAFRGNVIQNNRARGSLFTTPKKVVVENNTFRNVAGSAILLAGDAQGWYESGPCEDIVIRKNKFINNLTSTFQFTEAVISIYPEVKKLGEQKKFYHRNIVIEDNDFETFDVPLLFAISAENLKFKNNRIRYNSDFKGWNRKPFIFRRCADVTISGNKVVPAKKFSTDDCKLEMTDQKEVKFR